ncbi:farnesol dehydrogenase-like [Chrysoperla carnea]|uniref:farnesol dehydrogenase-like n=1 Tax=Chrysoperla carnea TaxID=189513 RepID=UPI001D08129A|nr:farnesol dehydrogenase-like [Chrysoperla carnea]
MQEVIGKVALVTGASSGVGAAIVRLLVKHGMTVIGVARRLDRLENLSTELKNESGQFHYRQVDMTKEEDIQAAFKFIKDKFSVMHVLVNNAGVLRFDTSLKDGSTESWRHQLDVNVTGVAIASREAVRLMKATNTDGFIININSITGLHVAVPFGKYANIYPATKHAVTAMTEALRQELFNENVKIRVSSICPGVIATDMFAGAIGTPLEKEFATDAPMLLPEEVADTVLFLLTRPINVEVTQIIIKPRGEQA